ncbi:glycoside hydrolase family 35 protein, partial [Neurospora crassa]
FRPAPEANIYLTARPDPYINAEVAAGGLPEWTLRGQRPSPRKRYGMALFHRILPLHARKVGKRLRS